MKNNFDDIQNGDTERLIFSLWQWLQWQKKDDPEFYKKRFTFLRWLKSIKDNSFDGSVPIGYDIIEIDKIKKRIDFKHGKRFFVTRKEFLFLKERYLSRHVKRGRKEGWQKHTDV